MRVAILGASGMIGTALCGSLTSKGHRVVRLVRRPPRSADEIFWNPATAHVELPALDGVEAVVNLAGADLRGQRATAAYKQTLYHSRVGTTHTLATALTQMYDRPRVLVSMSAAGIYGSEHGSEAIDEDEPTGDGFLADMCRAWEAAAVRAEKADIAVCHPRAHLIMSRRGGTLARMLPRFRKGLGGSLAGGRQYWSHVSLDDAVRALVFLVETHGCSGPYNLAAPEPVTNAEFSRVLARALGRPTLLPVPEFALRIRYGELADDFLSSWRLVPNRLRDAGFEFEHPDARSVVAAALR
jgi:uncharacterized protein